MLRVDRGELFPITVALWDEVTGENASGRTVYYDIRDENDSVLSPPLNGVLPESTVTSGIYRTTVSIDIPGEYVCYATCTNFYSSTEEIIVNPENIYEIAKQNRNYNIAVEDVLRTNITPTASQTIRKVPVGNTDYIVTVIKSDSDSDWDTATTSGVSFAWYRNITDDIPYRMGDDGL